MALHQPDKVRQGHVSAKALRGAANCSMTNTGMLPDGLAIVYG